MEVVKKKIQTLQLQVDEAEDRALAVQRELDTERELREKVRSFTIYPTSVAFSIFQAHVAYLLGICIEDCMVI